MGVVVTGFALALAMPASATSLAKGDEGASSHEAAIVTAVPKTDPALAEDTKDVDGAALSLPETNAWYEATDCSECHETIVESLDSDGYLTALHGAVLDCNGCHNVDELEPVHEEVHKGDKVRSALKKTAVDTAVVCESCHDGDALAKATADSTVLTDKNGTVVNPHELPATDTHKTGVSCVSCHQMHTTTTLEKNATKVCKSCHHENVYECGTCH